MDNWSWPLIFFVYIWLFRPGFLGNLICVLHGGDSVTTFYWVSLFQCHFSLSCYDLSFWWIFPLCVLFCISPRLWVILEVFGNLFRSPDFFPCMYCVFSFFQLSFQMLLSSDNHFHLFHSVHCLMAQARISFCFIHCYVPNA